MSAGKLRYTLVVRHPDTGIAMPLLKGESVPDWASDMVHEDDLDGPSGKKDKSKSKKSKKDKASGGSSDGGSSSEKTGYTGTNAELQSEIDKRNEGRADEDKVVVEGRVNKASLVAALEADDAKQQQ